VCIWWFAGKSIYRGEIPHFGSANSLYNVLEGNIALQISVSLSYLLLQLSIIVSCVLFLRMKSIAKWVAYIQIPLRLLFAVPSVSLLIIGIDTMPFHHDLLIPFALIFSELVKGAALWGSTFELKEGSQEGGGMGVSAQKNLSGPSLSRTSPFMSYPKASLSYFWIAVVIIVPLILIEVSLIYKVLTRDYSQYM
jgi:hypothetical protein